VQQWIGVLDGGRDAHVYALLRSKNGRWTTRAFVVGPTDVAWEEWSEQYHPPMAIFQ
jgi:hypothetical protein